VKNGTDFILAGVIGLVVIYLFYKTRSDFLKLTSKKSGTIYTVGRRSFFIKGVLFTILPIAMLKAASHSLDTIVIFSIILLLGIWNLIHAFLLMRYNQKNPESKI